MKARSVLALWVVSALRLLLFTVAEEYCHNDEFIADCLNDVVLMTSAFYGRMAVGHCVKTDFGFVGCSNNVLDHLHERCSGRQSCALRIPDSRLDSTKPCNDDLKSYLDTEYTCITAMTTAESCELTSDVNNVTGYISGNLPPSIASPDASQTCGSEATPWIITVLPGQRINFTLLDFTSNSSSPVAFSVLSADPVPAQTAAYSGVHQHSRRHSSSQCDVYAKIDESGTDTVELCGANRNRISPAYTSVGHKVKVRLYHRGPASGYNYLVKYEAIGCPDQTASKYVWHRRENNQLTVGCIRVSDVTWTLVCIGTHWEGSTPNCSIVAGNDPWRDINIPALSLGTSILIVFAVSLAIGVIVLIFGLYYLKRRRCRSALSTDMPMRDLKPLSSDTYDSSNTVYARNNAFQPIKVVKHPVANDQTGNGSGLTALAATDENIEYEYVWDASASDSAVVGHTENRPDLVRIEKSPSGGAPVAHGTGSARLPQQQQQQPQQQQQSAAGVIGSSSTAPRCRCVHKTPTGSPERRLPPKSATLNRMEYRTPSSGSVGGLGTTSGGEFSPPPLPVKMRDVFGAGGQQTTAALMGSPTESLGGTTVGAGSSSTTPRRVCYNCDSPTDPFGTIGGSCSPITGTTPGTGSLPRRGGGHSSASASPSHHASNTGSHQSAANVSFSTSAHSSSVTLPRRQTHQPTPPPKLL